jgi:hypothetical protein
MVIMIEVVASLAFVGIGFAAGWYARERVLRRQAP